MTAFRGCTSQTNRNTIWFYSIGIMHSKVVQD